jgi:tetratricopeptide (TPR) repeat protein
MWVSKSTPESGPLIDYLPRSSYGSIIFTTSDKKMAVRLAGRNVIEMSEMDEASSKQLLENYLVNQDLLRSEGDATALLTRLTYLPLAIVQAAVYINANGIGLGDYLSLLEEQEEDVIDLLSEDFEDEGRYRDVKNPVATTWLISFEQIRQRDPLAADYLSFMACIDAKDIPQSLLLPGPSRKKEIDAMGTLQGYSFITKRSAYSAVNTHRLVHLATRNWLRKEGLLPSWTSRVIARLAEVLGDVGHDNRVAWRLYMPHAYYALGSSLTGEDDEDSLNLLWKYGLCLYYDGRYSEAEALLERVIEMRKTKLGADHPYTLISMDNLALTYRKQGRCKKAEKLSMQVIETRTTKLGADHPDTLSSMSNLAWTYRKQGRWEEAEKLSMQVIKTRKIKIGADHPDTLSSMANLASTYQKQGRWEEAEKLGVQVMETRKTKLGADNLDTLISMAVLASTYQKQGLLEEAEELQAKQLKISTRVLGPRHPNTLTSMCNLAGIWKDRGRHGDALSLIQTCVDMRQQILGIGHPYTLSTLSTLDLPSHVFCHLLVILLFNAGEFLEKITATDISLIMDGKMLLSA